MSMSTDVQLCRRPGCVALRSSTSTDGDCAVHEKYQQTTGNAHRRVPENGQGTLAVTPGRLSEGCPHDAGTYQHGKLICDACDSRVGDHYVYGLDGLRWNKHRMAIGHPDCRAKERGGALKFDPPVAMAPPTDDYQENINRHARINTRCPSCGKQTIMIGPGRLLVCAFLGCREPLAINDAADAAVEHAATIDRLLALQLASVTPHDLDAIARATANEIGERLEAIARAGARNMTSPREQEARMRMAAVEAVHAALIKVTNGAR